MPAFLGLRSEAPKLLILPRLILQPMDPIITHVITTRTITQATGAEHIMVAVTAEATAAAVTPAVAVMGVLVTERFSPVDRTPILLKIGRH